MVHESMKSSLLWSIGGVGLVAGSVIAMAYLSHPPQTPSPDSPAIPAESTAVPETFTPTATDPWGRALEYGWEAAVAAQTAETEIDWRRVGDLWLQAVAELEQVPQSSPNRAEAQTKIQQYLANFEYAEAEKAKARALAPAASSGISATALKTALANGPMKVQFSVTKPDNGQARLAGQSADRQAKIELVGPAENLTQATLVLPKATSANHLSMADMVYTHHFLNATLPNWSGQSEWVATSLKQIQASPNQPIATEFGAYRVSMGTAARGDQVVITVSLQASDR